MRMKIGDLVLFNNRRKEEVLGIYLYKDKDTYTVQWFDDYYTTDEPRKEIHQYRQNFLDKYPDSAVKCSKRKQ